MNKEIEDRRLCRLVNFKNYLMYADGIKSGNISVHIPTDITKDNIEDHIEAIRNILKDGIELKLIQNMRITISWEDNIKCKLSIFDYWINLFMWHMLLRIGVPIRPKNIFYDDTLRVDNIAEYVDKFTLTFENKERLDNYTLNESIENATWFFSYVDDYSLFLANTINNEDDIDLMNASPEYDALLHQNFENESFETIKNSGQSIADKTIEFIQNSKKYIGYEHGLANSFRAREAINPRQYKESRINIGAKAIDDAVIPILINSSFATGGINTPEYFFAESCSARDSQIKSKRNVGDSGDLARILNINNIDTIFNKNKQYECMSTHFIKYEIKSKDHLKRIRGRRYRKNPNGIQHIITGNEENLIGSIIFLKSPMTCASHSSGKGICKACYGSLYNTNIDINPGIIAGELLTSNLTQRLLSAKHLSEVSVRSLKWVREFDEFMDVSGNIIQLTSGLDAEIANYKKYCIIIDPEEIYTSNEEEETLTTGDDDDTTTDTIYSDYVDHFVIRTAAGEIIDIHTEDKSPLYLTEEFSAKIKSSAKKHDDIAEMSLDSLDEIPLFYIRIINDPLTKALYDIKAIINKKAITTSFTPDEALQSIIDITVDIGMNIDSVHIEVLLSNQTVDESGIKKPNWNDRNAVGRLVSLDNALVNNTSPIISLLYKDINKVFYSPLTYKKDSPSFLDMFFMEKPQEYMRPDMIIDRNEAIVTDPNTKIEMCKIVEKKE